MRRIKKLEPVVLKVLKEHEDARKNNQVLIYRTYLELDGGIDSKSIYEVLTSENLPPTETITRVKRKLLEKYPELLDEELEQIRLEREEAFIRYSKTN